MRRQLWRNLKSPRCVGPHSPVRRNASQEQLTIGQRATHRRTSNRDIGGVDAASPMATPGDTAGGETKVSKNSKKIAKPKSKARARRSRQALRLPRPNLNGDYPDSCVVCLRGTDTGFAFRGVAEWIIAGIAVLGIPMDQAASMVSMATSCEQGMVPDGEFTIVSRVCQRCAEASGHAFQVRLLLPGQPINAYAPVPS